MEAGSPQFDEDWAGGMACAGSEVGEGAEQDYDDDDDNADAASSVMRLGERGHRRAGGQTPNTTTSGGMTPAQSSAASTKLKAKAKEEKKKCKLCKKWYCLDEFPLNSSYCREDKRTVDCLYHQAIAQGKLEWYQEVRQDPDRLEQLVKKFNEKCPKTGPKSKRGAFSLVTFIEEYEASSKVENTAAGKLMWWGEYLHFARKPKGGPEWERQRIGNNRRQAPDGSGVENIVFVC